MDDLVEKALARWPNVPAIAGWLKLTTQGNWMLTGPVPAGLSITNQRILNFIARNYGCEADGRYFFQNGPQKAYVTLEYTPWIWRIYPLDGGALMLASHTGLVLWPIALWADEVGRLLIQTSQGIGLVHSADTARLADGLQDLGEGTSATMAHTAHWAVPVGDPDTVVSTNIRLRALKGETPGERRLCLPVQTCESSQVARQFHFEPNPTV
ncbi:DUF2946 family protein [Limnobacter humi]|uniref:DUF2946 family protein n=1 Tax=Limnobacter humi TaxID=1778671 RepID=A0ABT1WEL1_9BURK|nr:DUF2946 family protein [Limnobacter humi]MCQ8895177.1 DUF2946 family protein [Limnobacter humi]